MCVGVQQRHWASSVLQKPFPALLNLLEDEASDVRRRAAGALGQLSSPEAIPGLLKLVEDTDVYVRRRAAELLCKLGSPEAIPGLLKLLDDTDFNVRERAVEALVNIAEQFTDSIIPYFPQLLNLVAIESGATVHSVILAIQSACKFYNYALTQTVHSLELSGNHH